MQGTQTPSTTTSFLGPSLPENHLRYARTMQARKPANPLKCTPQTRNRGKTILLQQFVKITANLLTSFITTQHPYTQPPPSPHTSVTNESPDPPPEPAETRQCVCCTNEGRVCPPPSYVFPPLPTHPFKKTKQQQEDFLPVYNSTTFAHYSNHLSSNEFSLITHKRHMHFYPTPPPSTAAAPLRWPAIETKHSRIGKALKRT